MIVFEGANSRSRHPDRCSGPLALSHTVWAQKSVRTRPQTLRKDHRHLVCGSFKLQDQRSTAPPLVWSGVSTERKYNVLDTDPNLNLTVLPLPWHTHGINWVAMLLKLSQMTSMVDQPYRQENNPFTGGVMKLESKSHKGILTKCIASAFKTGSTQLLPRHNVNLESKLCHWSGSTVWSIGS